MTVSELQAESPVGPAKVSHQVELQPQSIMSRGVRATLAGLWGELLVAERLESDGWQTELEGGYTKGRDVVASHPNGPRILVQVKATTKVKDIINWAKPGVEKVKPFIADAAKRKATAVFVLVHLGLPTADRDGDFLKLGKPPVLAMTACTAAEWGQKVDEARLWYSQQKRQSWKLGDETSEYLPASGCIHPCSVTDFQPLADFLQDHLETTKGVE